MRSSSSSSSGAHTSRQRRTDNNDKVRLSQKELLHDLDSSADAALIELVANERDLVQCLRRAAKFDGSDATLSEIAANLAPLLIARKRLQVQMKAYSDDSAGSHTQKVPRDRSTPWERSPWKQDAASDVGETHRFHLLAQGTDVADLAIERLATNKKADKRILKLTTPPVNGAEFVNGAWRFGDQARPGGAGAVSSGHKLAGQRPKSSGPCHPTADRRMNLTVDGLVRRALTPQL